MSTVTTAQNYSFLKGRFAQIANLEHIAGILGKDAQTAMAKGSRADRTQQLVALSDSQHILIADQRVAEALDRVEADIVNLPPEDKRNLALMRREWVHKASLPSSLASEAAYIEAEGERRHDDLYRSGDWNAMRDWYSRSFKVMRDVGEAKKDALGVSSAYEALLDRFSPGLRTADIDAEFAMLDKALRIMIPEAIDRQARMPQPLPLEGPFDTDAQISFCRALAQDMGFDDTRGVISAIKGHPSMGGSPDDARLTTRIGEDDLIPGIYALIHETGHAMYEQGLPVDWRYQPAGHSLGMDIHESQSMIMEYQAAMTMEFFRHLAARLQASFSRHADPAFTADNIGLVMRRVQPSFIRVDADELTYPMHILLRHDLESRAIGGTLDVRDLPDAWNDGMKQRLGITPPDASKGCMQDVHWPVGLPGYFPAYTLGGMGAAQLMAAALKARPDILPELAQGRFTPLREWLRDHVHSKGSLLTSSQVLEQATGEKLNSRHYLNHLSSRYLGRLYTRKDNRDNFT